MNKINIYILLLVFFIAGCKSQSTIVNSWSSSLQGQLEISEIQNSAYSFSINYINNIKLHPIKGDNSLDINSEEAIYAKKYEVTRLQEFYPDAPISELQLIVDFSFVKALNNK
jgi:hypothetical protein